jgi:SAM-dependent methyltransferase
MTNDDIEIKKKVRERYAQAAGASSSAAPSGGASRGCCAPPAAKSGCGCSGGVSDEEKASLAIGYSAEDLGSLPEEANLGLGCGNPAALAGLAPGETVLDLGSGAGIDCFLAARRVGAGGRVIGVDMTPEMLDKARENARRGDYGNVEFRLGEIENLPVADASVDVIISNCVINLSTDKARVFREALRVLRPGGRLLVSDLVLLKPLPEAIRRSAEVYVACVAGAMAKDDYIGAVRDAGFSGVEVVKETPYPADLILDSDQANSVIEKLGIPADELRGHLGSVVSLNLKALKSAR